MSAAGAPDLYLFIFSSSFMCSCGHVNSSVPFFPQPAKKPRIQICPRLDLAIVCGLWASFMGDAPKWADLLIGRPNSYFIVISSRRMNRRVSPFHINFAARVLLCNPSVKFLVYSLSLLACSDRTWRNRLHVVFIFIVFPT